MSLSVLIALIIPNIYSLVPL